MRYSRLNTTPPLPEAFLANKLYFVAVLGALLLPAAWSMIFGFLALRSEEAERIAKWSVYVGRMRVLNVFAVPAWWSLSGAFAESGAKLPPILDWPQWVLTVLPLSIGIGAARFVTWWTDSKIDGRRWTIADLLRLSLWSSISSTVPLLLFAVGIDAIDNRSSVAVLWIGGAGLLARFAKAGFRSAEGLKPRFVKSGELFKRSFAMAKQTGVHLIGVFVYPTGRGRLANAHGGAGFIGMTDVCIHWLHGAQLDFVIGHELAHVRQRHPEKLLRIGVGAFLGVAGLVIVVPHQPLLWRIFFKFGVILIPLLVFYFVSRRFELVADRVAMDSTGDGESAIRALANLYYHSGVRPESSRFNELFLTHPSLWRRIDAIARAGQIPMEYVTSVRQEFNERVGDLGLPHGPD